MSDRAHPPDPPETPGRGPTVEVVLADGPPIDLDAWARKYAQLLLEELEEEEARSVDDPPDSTVG